MNRSPGMGSEQVLRHLADAITRVRWQSTEEDIFHEVEKAMEGLGFQIWFLCLEQQPGAQAAALVQPRAGQRPSPLLPELVVPLAERALKERRTMQVPGGAVEVVILPLHVNEQPRGTMVLGADSVPSAEVAALELFVADISVCLEHLSLVAKVERRDRELVLLNRLSQRSATQDLPEVLELAAQAVAYLVQAETVAVYLGENADSPWLLASSMGLAAEELAPSIERGTSTLEGLAWKRRRRTFVQPVALRGEAIGVIAIGRDLDEAIDAETRALLETAAAQVAINVEVARLLAESRKQVRQQMLLNEVATRSFEALERAQAELVKRERLAALGELAAVIAHEVRNPLGAIFNSVTSLRRMVEPKPEAQMLLGVVAEEADRLNRIVGDLLDFARAPEPQFEQGELSHLLEEVLGVALAAIGDTTIEVVRSYARGLPSVLLDLRLMRQALLNVALNGLQAMPKGGRLSVRSALDAGETSRVRIEFEDTGSGIPEPLRPRIFEPFFTTKATGTGLGLAVVKRVVDSHRGEVEVHSEVGRGTRVAILLPVRQPRLAEATIPEHDSEFP